MEICHKEIYWIYKTLLNKGEWHELRTLSVKEGAKSASMWKAKNPPTQVVSVELFLIHIFEMPLKLFVKATYNLFKYTTSS